MVAQSVAHKRPQHTYRKRGFYYYRRRVPKDLWSHYRKTFIVIAMQTRCRRTAKEKAKLISSRLELLWSDLRFDSDKVPAAHLLVSDKQSRESVPRLSEALEMYLAVKGADRGVSFEKTSVRAVGYAISHSGNLPIDRYSRADANGLRDWLAGKGLAPQSIKRMFSVVRTVVNLAINEHALSCKNVFANVEYGKISPVRQRNPIPDAHILQVQRLCREIDDPNRRLVALISDTGMRLSEAVGLAIADFVLNAEHPHLNLCEHEWRKLKTGYSIRKIPLVGASYWAAERIIETAEGDLAFPKYATHEQIRANSASAAINKWLANHVPDHCVIHSFRHSLRDRLRAIECPTDIVDQIGGWKTNGGVGQTYGDGYPLNVLAGWLTKMAIP